MLYLTGGSRGSVSEGEVREVSEVGEVSEVREGREESEVRGRRKLTPF